MVHDLSIHPRVIDSHAVGSEETSHSSLVSAQVNDHERYTGGLQHSVNATAHCFSIVLLEVN